MSILRTVIRRVTDGDDWFHYYECRSCGTTVDTPEETCPTCGCEEIAEYRLGEK